MTEKNQRPKDQFSFRDRYDIHDLLVIMKMLRAPDGCPWDRVQTHQSIRQNFIEETYEAIEAIDTENAALLKEELGDVLMQVIFHTIMEEELDHFDFDDVCNDVCQKLIVRHPHVFSDVVAETPEKVLDNWDAIKMKTKDQSAVADSVDDVAKSLPALMRAQKIGKRAAKSGMDFDDAPSALEKAYEELDELKASIVENDADKQFEELGDLLFSVTNVARLLKIDSELSLTRASEKFADRFRKTEALARERGVDMKTASLEELDVLWDEVKRSS